MNSITNEKLLLSIQDNFFNKELTKEEAYIYRLAITYLKKDNKNIIVDLLKKSYNNNCQYLDENDFKDNNIEKVVNYIKEYGKFIEEPKILHSKSTKSYGKQSKKILTNIKNHNDKYVNTCLNKKNSMPMNDIDIQVLQRYAVVNDIYHLNVNSVHLLKLKNKLIHNKVIDTNKVYSKKEFITLVKSKIDMIEFFNINAEYNIKKMIRSLLYIDNIPSDSFFKSYKNGMMYISRREGYVYNGLIDLMIRISRTDFNTVVNYLIKVFNVNIKNVNIEKEEHLLKEIHYESLADTIEYNDDDYTNEAKFYNDNIKQTAIKLKLLDREIYTHYNFSSENYNFITKMTQIKKLFNTMSVFLNYAAVNGSGFVFGNIYNICAPLTNSYLAKHLNISEKTASKYIVGAIATGLLEQVPNNELPIAYKLSKFYNDHQAKKGTIINGKRSYDSLEYFRIPRKAFDDLYTFVNDVYKQHCNLEKLLGKTYWELGRIKVFAAINHIASNINASNINALANDDNNITNISNVNVTTPNINDFNIKSLNTIKNNYVNNWLRRYHKAHTVSTNITIADIIHSNINIDNNELILMKAINTNITEVSLESKYIQCYNDINTYQFALPIINIAA